MAKSRVTIEELDGQIGFTGPSSVAMAIGGTAAAGPYTARAFSRPKDVIAAYTAGNLVEAACQRLKNWGGIVILCRVNAADTGEATLVTTGFTGTSVPTVHASGLAPHSTLQARVRFSSGGTIGTAGITYQESYDEGRTWGALKALGTANDIDLSAAHVGTVTLDFAAGTVAADSVLVVNCVAPAPTGGEIVTALTACGNHDTDWDCFEPADPIDPTIAAALDTEIIAQRARGPRRYWNGNARLPTPGETLAVYSAAVLAAWESHVSPRGEGHVCYSNCHLVSAVSGLKQRRPVVWAVAPYIDRLPRHVDPAYMAQNGPIPGVSLSDDSGNPELHDEDRNAGPDDARFITLCTDPDYAGVYVTNGRTRAPAGSDFRYVQHRRIMNRAERLLRAFAARYLSAGVATSPSTGRILPSFARRFKSEAEAYILGELGVAPSVAGVTVTPSTTHNVLATETLPVELAVQPLAYFKAITVTAYLTVGKANG